MRIHILALLGSLGCSIAATALAQDGPSLVEQLTGGRPNNANATAADKDDVRKETIIQVDEIPDDLKVPLSDKVRETVTGLPAQWNTMTEVKDAYGEPFETRGPTGEPPITQWFYRDFVVYFEHDQVIHTVFKAQ